MSVSGRYIFSTFEKSLLLQLVEERKMIIENKRTNKETNKKKERAWEKITEIFNASVGVERRRVIQLKQLYKNIKKNASKYASSAPLPEQVMEMTINVKTEPLSTDELYSDAPSIEAFNNESAASDYQDMDDEEFLILPHADKLEIPAMQPAGFQRCINSTNMNKITAMQPTYLDVSTTTQPILATTQSIVPAPPNPTSQHNTSNSIYTPPNNSTPNHASQAHQNSKILRRKRNEDGDAPTNTTTAAGYIAEECQKRIDSIEKADARAEEEHEIKMKKFKMEQREHEMRMRVLEEQRKMYEGVNRLLLQNSNMSFVLTPNL